MFKILQNMNLIRLFFLGVLLIGFQAYGQSSQGGLRQCQGQFEALIPLGLTDSLPSSSLKESEVMVRMFLDLYDTKEPRFFSVLRDYSDIEFEALRPNQLEAELNQELAAFERSRHGLPQTFATMNWTKLELTEYQFILRRHYMKAFLAHNYLKNQIAPFSIQYRFRLARMQEYLDSVWSQIKIAQSESMNMLLQLSDETSSDETPKLKDDPRTIQFHSQFVQSLQESIVSTEESPGFLLRFRPQNFSLNEEIQFLDYSLVRFQAFSYYTDFLIFYSESLIRSLDDLPSSQQKSQLIDSLNLLLVSIRNEIRMFAREVGNSVLLFQNKNTIDGDIRYYISKVRNLRGRILLIEATSNN